MILGDDCIGATEEQPLFVSFCGGILLRNVRYIFVCGGYLFVSEPSLNTVLFTTPFFLLQRWPEQMKRSSSVSSGNCSGFLFIFRDVPHGNPSFSRFASSFGLRLRCFFLSLNSLFFASCCSCIMIHDQGP